MDHRADETAFRQDLKNIASTTLSSKLLTYEKNLFGTAVAWGFGALFESFYMYLHLPSGCCVRGRGFSSVRLLASCLGVCTLSYPLLHLVG